MTIYSDYLQAAVTAARIAERYQKSRFASTGGDAGFGLFRRC